MTTRKMLKQLGGTTILFGALALVPFPASAMMSKHDIDTPTSTANMGAEAAFHANPSSNGKTLVPRVGFVNIHGAHSHAQAQSNTKSKSKSARADVVLVPRVGYVDVKAIS